MSWNITGDLYCNCCYKTVILKDKVTKKDIEENTGKTFCEECCRKFGNKFDEFVKEYYKDKRKSYDT